MTNLGQRGSATVSSIGLMVAVVLLAGALLVSAHLYRGIQRASHIANLVALATSDVSLGVVPGLPCLQAKEIAHLNGANLEQCELHNNDAFVAVTMDFYGFEMARTALAGPMRRTAAQ